MIYVKDQTVTVWKIEDMGKYSQVRFSSSRKDKRTDQYVNTTWSFVRFVGEAHEKLKSLGIGERDRIVINGGLSREPFEKNGETAYPQNVQFVVFNFKKYNPEETASRKPRTEDMPRLEDDVEEGSSVPNDEIPW